MARSTIYSRADVLAAALAVADRAGIAGLTARRVAAHLGASTAPVYSNFASMEELQRAVVREARDLLLDYARERVTESAFLDMGVGVTRFAREHAKLYRLLFLDGLPGYDPAAEIFATLLEELAAVPGVADLDPALREELLDALATFTHGLAMTICTGAATRPTPAECEGYLRAVGGVFIEEARRRAAAGTPLFPGRTDAVRRPAGPAHTGDDGGRA